MRFKVSSNIKNILGREMISNKYIAIFELVKNSCDAGAKKVSINFSATNNVVNKIIISDDGCGMDSNDLQNKWLFVAYSEKRHGDLKNKMAGSKGIGRFSCDRLGSRVVIYTKKEEYNYAEKLDIDWELFELNDEKKVEEIELNHSVIPYEGMFSKSGTVLEITNLREEWKRNDIIRLRRELMKLVSPEESDREEHAQIEIIAEHEKKTDEFELRKKEFGAAKSGFGNLVVNGIIVNDVFEKLGLKTTIINVKVSENGDTIETSIEDRGLFVFKILRRNESYSLLENINIKLFYLNRSAKLNFARIMGVESVNYGSIFVYKNGFRIYPYGENGIDFFGINERKSQGYKRYLGTRELMGRIEINGDNDHFIEKSSRDGGFIDNPSTQQLETLFITEAVRVLEKYVVEGIDWGDPSREDFVEGINEQGLYPVDVADKVLSQFANLSKRDTVIKAEINPSIISKANIKEDLLKKSIRTLEKISATSSSDDIKNLVYEIKKGTDSLENQRKENERKIDELSESLKNKENELKTREKQKSILEKKLDLDPIQYEDALHLIYVLSEANKKEIETLYKRIEKQDNIIMDKLVNVYHNNNRIYKLSDLSINYKIGIDIKKPKDIVSAVKDYVNITWSNQILVIVETQNPDDKIICNFDMSKLSIIIDNIISNSKKAKAKKVVLTIQKNDYEIIFLFMDDGVGIDKSISNPNDIFERGYSTTFGFGLGLYHLKKIVESMSGSVRVIEGAKNGFGLEVRIKYECKF